MLEQGFAEIAFCAVTANEQVKGFGTRLMNYTKVRPAASSPQSLPLCCRINMLHSILFPHTIHSRLPYAKNMSTMYVA